MSWLDLFFLVKGNILGIIQPKGMVLCFIKKLFPVTFIIDNKETVKQVLFRQKLQLANDAFNSIMFIYTSSASIWFQFSVLIRVQSLNSFKDVIKT